MSQAGAVSSQCSHVPASAAGEHDEGPQHRTQAHVLQGGEQEPRRGGAAVRRWGSVSCVQGCAAGSQDTAAVRCAGGEGGQVLELEREGIGCWTLSGRRGGRVFSSLNVYLASVMTGPDHSAAVMTGPDHSAAVMTGPDDSAAVMLVF